MMCKDHCVFQLNFHLGEYSWLCHFVSPSATCLLAGASCLVLRLAYCAISAATALTEATEGPHSAFFASLQISQTSALTNYSTNTTYSHTQLLFPSHSPCTADN